MRDGVEKTSKPGSSSRAGKPEAKAPSSRVDSLVRSGGPQGKEKSCDMTRERQKVFEVYRNKLRKAHNDQLWAVELSEFVSAG